MGTSETGREVKRVRRPRSLVIGLIIMAVLTLVGATAAAGGSKATTPTVDVVTVPSEPVYLPSVSTATQEVSILSIDVSVNVPGDEEWKAIYGASWGPYCSAVIEAADDAMYTQFGINLYVSTYQDWDSNDSQMDITKLLAEAKSERGLNGKKLMIAFTAQVQNCGAAYVGGRYSIVAESWAKNQICQHEVSHNYGADHSTCGGDNCVIADCVGHYGQWCGTCWTTIYNNRNSK
jgi:hypothetical protein